MGHRLGGLCIAPRDEPDNRYGTEDPIEISRAKWEEYAEIHPDTEHYNASGFVEDPDESTLHPLEQELLGDISGQSLVHLQCHIGLDTLSWAREGASIVGVDFASTAVETARELRDWAGLTDDASFVVVRFTTLPRTLHGSSTSCSRHTVSCVGFPTSNGGRRQPLNSVAPVEPYFSLILIRFWKLSGGT